MTPIFYFSFDGVRMHLDMGKHCSQALYFSEDSSLLVKHRDGLFKFVVYAAAQIHAGKAMISLLQESLVIDDERAEDMVASLEAEQYGWLRQTAEEHWPTHRADEVDARLQAYCDKISDFFVCDDKGNFVFRWDTP